MQAEISLEYITPEFARSIMNAIAPDNAGNGRVRISARVRGRWLRVNIHGCSRVETLEATVQDVFRCIRAAEESLTKTSSLGKLL